MPKKKTKPNVLASGVMDVSKPGKSAPANNSKHVIVNSREIIKDPMVKDDDASTDDVIPAIKPVSKIKIKVEPLSAPPLDSKSELKILKSSTDEPDESAEPAPVPSTSEPIPAAEAEPELETPDQTESTVTEETAPQELLPETDSKPDPKPEPVTDASDKILSPLDDAKDSDAPAKVSPTFKKDITDPTSQLTMPADEAKLQKLVDGKKYFLPINSVEKRRSKRVVISGIILSLLLIVAWADIALDAGLIEISGINPVTSFFSN